MEKYQYQIKYFQVSYMVQKYKKHKVMINLSRARPKHLIA